MPYARARPVISGPSTYDNILNPGSTAFPRGPEGGPCTSPLILALRKWEPLPILCLLNVFNRVIAADITNWTMKEMAAHRDFERGDRWIFSSRDWGRGMLLAKYLLVLDIYIYSTGTSVKLHLFIWLRKIKNKLILITFSYFNDYLNRIDKIYAIFMFDYFSSKKKKQIKNKLRS